MKNSIGKVTLLLIIVLVVKAILVLEGADLLALNQPNLYQINRFPDDYDKIAQNLIDGQGYRVFPETSPTLMRGPGYVFFLAGLYRLFGKQLWIIQIFNMLLTCATAALLYQISKRFLKNKALTLSVVTIFMLHPAVILSETRCGAENLFILLLALFVYFIYRAIDKGKAVYFVAPGLALGLSCLVKSTPIVMPLFVLGYLFIDKNLKGKILENFKSIAVLTIAMAIVIFPWAYRNYLLTGRMVPTTTIAGSTAYQGLYYNKNISSSKNHYQLIREAVKELDKLAVSKNLKFKKGFFQYFYNPRDEVFFNNLVLDLVKNDYLSSPKLMIKSAILNFSGFWFQGRTKRTTLLNIIITTPLLILSIAGIYFGLKTGRDLVFLIIFMIAFISVHLPILGVARYQLPLLPFMLILSMIPFDRRKYYSPYE